MSDRWKDELKKLRGVEPPAGLWDRAQEPPTADRLPPRRERIVAGVVAMSVFVAAGAFAFQALRPPASPQVGSAGVEEPRVTVTFLESDPRYGDLPNSELVFEDTIVRGQMEGYGWGGSVVDAMTPDLSDTVTIPQGADLVIEGDADSVNGYLGGTMYPFEKVFGIDLEDGIASLDAEPGRYALALTGHWAKGDVPFFFGIEILEGPTTQSPSEASPVQPVEAADALHITCDESSISADEPVVAAQRAGVHVVVDNRSGGTRFLQYAPEPEGPWGGTQVPRGTTDLALQARPGSFTVRCSDAEAAVSEELEIQVRDDQDLFVPFDLTCQPALTSTIASFPWPGGESPVAPEPIGFVRAVTDGLISTDVVERAAYPEVAGGIVRVIRDGAVVASFVLFQPDDWAPGILDGWAASMTACADSGISIPPGPDPYPRGWFEWCPEGPFPEAGRDWSEQASEVAIRFVRAYAEGDQATLADVLDVSVPAGAEFRVVLAEGAEPTVAVTDAHGGQIVNYSCGNDVDAYTVAVTIDDGTASASLDFTVFLILREDGWKVWGVY